MKLKVCGMRELDNIKGLAALAPDWMGLIFYEPSPRFPKALEPEQIEAIDIQKVGVFVKENKETMLEHVKQWKLDYVQLHGDESVKEVKELKAAGLKIIKVFRVSDRLPEDMEDFAPYVDYFLFDTKADNAYGGTGHKFDWQLLRNYDGEVPYLLSGGISDQDIEEIKALNLKKCVGLDVNSKVEYSPGVKDLEKVKRIKDQL